MTVVVQEFDGFFTHNIQIEENTSTYEIPCHSKIRKLVIIISFGVYMCRGIMFCVLLST